MQIDQLDDLVGQTLPVKFLEIEEDRDRLVFSARRASNEKDLRTFNVWAVLSQSAGCADQVLLSVQISEHRLKVLFHMADCCLTRLLITTGSALESLHAVTTRCVWKMRARLISCRMT